MLRSLWMVATSQFESVLEGLNEPQRLAVTHGEGPLLILAGPGSGKTRVITHRIAYQVLEHRVAPWRIVAVTFTNKAAKEMRDRSEGLLGEDARRVSLGTFHALCARWLRTDGKEIGLDPNYVIYDDADQLGQMKRIIADLRLDVRKYAPRSILSAISHAKSEMISAAAYRAQVKTYHEEIVARAYEAYELALTRASAMDFDDLLSEMVRLLRESPATLEKYSGRFLHVLVDEFQDTNPAQYALAQLLASAHRNICVVGDPDQGIYSWRSADIRNVLNFERDFPDANVILLEQNYRSTKPILAAADAVIGRNPGRKDRTLWTERDGGDLVSIYEAYNDEEEGEYVAVETRRIVREGTSPRDIAVMYRTNAQSRAIEDAMVRHRIVYRVVGGMRFYQRKEVKDLIAYLRVIHNPNDEAGLLRIMNLPPRGIGDRSIERLRELETRNGLGLGQFILSLADGAPAEGIVARSLNAIREFGKQLASLRNDRVPLDILFDEVLTVSGYGRWLRDADDGEERFENVAELRRVITEYTETAGLEGDLAVFLADISLQSDADEHDPNAEAVTLISLHSAKGLEFPVVFMVGMEEGILPHIRSFDDPKQAEEERRLAYVGITRAKDRLYLSRAYRRFTFAGASSNPASRFLKDIPMQLTQPFGGKPRTFEEAVLAPQRASSEFRPATAVFVSGQQVRHGKFGRGTVVAVFERKDDVEYTISFEAAGLKKLLQSYITDMHAV